MLQLILLLVLGIDWASGYAIAGYCMTHGVSPYGYAFWQSFGPMILLLFIQFIIKPGDIKLNKVTTKYVLLSGISGILIPNLLIYLAASHVPSGLLTILANISPLFVYSLALLYREERFSVIRSSSILMGIIGVLLIIGTRQQFESSIGISWMILALLIPLGYAFCAVYVSKFRPENGNSINYAFGMLLISSLFNIPLVYIHKGFYPLNFSDFRSQLIVLEIMLSGLGYVLMFVIINKVGAVYYTLVNVITALTGVIYGYFIFDQRYPNNIYSAIIIILIALIGLTFTQRNKFKSWAIN